MDFFQECHIAFQSDGIDHIRIHNNADGNSRIFLSDLSDRIHIIIVAVPVFQPVSHHFLDKIRLAERIGRGHIDLQAVYPMRHVLIDHLQRLFHSRTCYRHIVHYFKTHICLSFFFFLLWTARQPQGRAAAIFYVFIPFLPPCPNSYRMLRSGQLLKCIK